MNLSADRLDAIEKRLTFRSNPDRPLSKREFRDLQLLVENANHLWHSVNFVKGYIAGMDSLDAKDIALIREALK
jgi:hypothetical protein